MLFECQPRDARFDVEPSRPRCSGIDHQSCPVSFDQRFVSVTIYDDIGAVCCQQSLWGGAAELVTMADMNAHTCDVKVECGLQVRISRSVGVAVDGLHWRDCPQLLQHATATDIAGMQDQLDAFEDLEDSWPHQAMRVCNQANDHDRHQ